MRREATKGDPRFGWRDPAFADLKGAAGHAVTQKKWAGAGRPRAVWSTAANIGDLVLLAGDDRHILILRANWARVSYRTDRLEEGASRVV